MAEDTSIFQEIDDALKVDNMEKMLRRYGKLIIGLCIAIVLTTIISVLWKNHQREVDMRNTSLMLKAQDMIVHGKPESARDLLADALKADSGLPAVVKMQYAAALVQSKQPDKAQEIYSEIARGNTEKSLRALAAINADILTEKTKSSAYQKLDYGSGAPFATLAGQVEALHMQKEGKTKEAHDILENQTADLSLSMPAHEMATELLNGLNGDKK